MTLNIPSPSEKQKLFLKADNTYVAFGGARGGGKSWAVRVKSVLLCLNYPGIKVLIIRRTYPELRQNHIIPLCQMLKCHLKDGRIATYNDSKKEITFPLMPGADAPSTILFGYCDNDKDAEKYQGTECDVLFIDEATHQSEERVEKLNACVRGNNDFPKRTYYTCNPGGEGHAWVKRLFIDKRYKGSEDPNDYTFIQSKVTDNTALMASDPMYMRRLENLPPKLRKAWLEGDWDIFEGQFFEEFQDKPEGYITRQWTHVVEPFEIPRDWTIYRSFDWGYARPFSCGWFAIDYEGTAYRILELYGCTETPNEGVKWTPDQVFSEIHKIETEHRWLRGKKIIGVADPAIWSAETGESIADVAARHYVYFNKGDNKRIAGWMQMHHRFTFDKNGYPSLYIFKNCKGFIRTIPTLIYDDIKVEDLDTSGEDHIADETRYFLMMNPIEPKADAVRDPYEDSVLKTVFNIPKEMLGTARIIPQMEIIE